ncbi:hypothetical protein KJ599_03680, partial [bacterium]|nr:hypothetical protein [bacterium]
AKKIRLSKHQLAKLMGFLCIHERWDTPSREVSQFGEQFGFIGTAWTEDQFIFPLAYILSFMSCSLSEVTVKHIIKEISSKIIDGNFSLKHLAEESIQEKFTCLTESECYIIKAREGLLTGKKMTLQWLGDQYGTARERIRQMEAKAWRKLRHPVNGPTYSRALIYNIMSKQGSLMVKTDSPEMLTIGFLSKCSRVPYATLSHINLAILGVLPEDTILVKHRRVLLDNIDSVSIINQWESEGRLCLTKRDLQFLAESIIRFRLKRLSKEQRVYLALQTIGKPAHSTKITEVYNSLFPEHPSNEYNLHAVLSREKYGVVWIGIRCIFALKEWGYEHPSRTLFNKVTKIVEKKYKETTRPVPFKIIIAEMGKCRQVVKHSSLTIASYRNPNLLHIDKNSFIPKKPDEDKKKFSKRS